MRKSPDAVVSEIAFRPLDELIDEADQRLADVEGGALEKLVGQLYEERSRKGMGDFPITFGSCKRSPAKLLSDVNNFKQHVERFLKSMPRYQHWTKHYVGISPLLSNEHRSTLQSHDIIPQDLNDLTLGLHG